MDVLAVPRHGVRSNYFQSPGGKAPIWGHLGERREARAGALPIHCSVTFGSAATERTKSIQQ